MGHSLKWHLKRVDAYLEEHPEADLNNIEDFWYPDSHTNPGSAIRGLVCLVIYEKDGIQGLRRLMSYTSLKEIFRDELKVENGSLNSYLRRLIKKYSQF